MGARARPRREPPGRLRRGGPDGRRSGRARRPRGRRHVVRPRRAVAFGATCVFAVYDPVSRRLAVASAGHPPPAVAAPDGRVEYVPVRPGPPLGVGGLPFEVAEVEVAPAASSRSTPTA
ncbi:PP2C family protein-serine/threonine phosphatase [Kitasatospora aburaviensis]